MELLREEMEQAEKNKPEEQPEPVVKKAKAKKKAVKRYSSDEDDNEEVDRDAVGAAADVEPGQCAVFFNSLSCNCSNDRI